MLMFTCTKIKKSNFCATSKYNFYRTLIYEIVVAMFFPLYLLNCLKNGY